MRRLARIAIPLLASLMLVSQVAAAPPHQLANFRAVLSGAEEVPPVETRARGVAIFQLSMDGTELHFRLNVANIENVTQAHIHCGAPGVNGPVVAWLYPAGTTDPELIPGRSNGPLDQGTITNDEVIPRPDTAVCPGGVANFSDLLEKIRTGEAYVNVHTSQFLPGEIRGQIR